MYHIKFAVDPASVTYYKRTCDPSPLRGTDCQGLDAVQRSSINDALSFVGDTFEVEVEEGSYCYCDKDQCIAGKCGNKDLIINGTW